MRDVANKVQGNHTTSVDLFVVTHDKPAQHIKEGF